MKYENTNIFEPNVIDTLLTHNDINESDLLNLIAKFKLSKNGFCDIYFQKRLSESWAIEEGIVKSGSFSIDQGFGLRNVLNDQTGFSFSDHISKKTLIESINAVNQIYKSNESFAKPITDKPI
jgi:TldD protein